MQDDELVLLTTCGNTVEAAATKSMLEAEGIVVFIHGEHHRAQLGFLGTYVDLRLMVRAAALSDAKELLEEAKYAEHIAPEDDGSAADDLSIQRWRERAGSEPATTDDDELTVPALRPRSIAVPIALGIVLGLGTGHLYGGRFKTALALFILQALSTAYLAWPLVIVAVAILRLADAIGGARAIRKHNAALAAIARPPP